DPGPVADPGPPFPGPAGAVGREGTTMWKADPLPWRLVLFRPGTGVAVATAVLTFSLFATTNRSAADRNAATGKQSSVVFVTAGKPSEHEFRVSPSSVKRGKVVFKITNLGKQPHTFGISGHVSKILRSHESTT